jgi:hypothetical protein
MEGKNPREGWAALVLGHYASQTRRHNRRAWHWAGLLWCHRHPVGADQRSKPLPHVIFTSDLGVVREHCRQHTPLGVIGCHMCRAGAEATLLVQRHAAAVIQDRELVHVDVHPLLGFTRQLRPRAQANNRDTHTANDNGGER